MLKRLWEYIWGPSRSDVMFKMILDNQDRSQQLLFQAVSAITSASGEQAKVLGEYLKLFNTPGDPGHWVQEENQMSDEENKRIGFPDDFAQLSDKEQAEWILDHIDRM